MEKPLLFRRNRWQGLVALALFGLLPAAPGQLRPDTPLRDFRLPVFGPDGHRLWDLTGRSGQPRDDGTIAIEGLTLRLYSGGERQTLEALFKADDALLRPEERSAEGAGRLLVEARNYSMDGTGWRWDGRERTLRLSGGVRAVFLEGLPGLLD